MAWTNWEDIEVKVDGLHKSIQGAPAVVSWEKGKLHVFVHGKTPDANIYHGSNETNSWQWKQIPVAPPATSLESSIAAVSWGKDRIDLFAVGGDKKVYHCAWNGSKWDDRWDVGPDSDNGKTESTPAAASWKKDRMDVIIRATNNQMSNQHFENETGKQWSKWSNAGGHMKSLDSAPAAAASGPNRIDCFVREFNNKKQLLHTGCDGTSYDSITDSTTRMKYDWVRPGGMVDETYDIEGAPAAASTPLGTGRVDVFARSSTKRLIQRKFLTDKWTSNWEKLSDYEITGDPAAVAWFGKDHWWEGNALKRIDCFALGNNDILKHAWNLNP